MSYTLRARSTQAALCFVSATALAGILGANSSAQGRSDVVRLKGHVPSSSFARKTGTVDAQERVDLALTLPLRNQAELNGVLTRLYTPGDALYGQYLSSEEFQSRFSPTEAEYNAVASFATAQGLTVTRTHANRLVLDVAGTAGAVEQAFSTKLARFQAKTGRVFRAPEVDPAIPAALAGAVSGVVGLDDLAQLRPHNRRLDETADVRAGRAVAPRAGSGPGGGYAPNDIKAAYSLSGTSLNGSGQVLALFELDGYNPTDITTYENQFGLPHVPLQNILIDGYSGAAGSGADEVTLDIELQVALAPAASKIMVYEGPNSGQGVIDTYNQIAVDNVAKSVSTSWGLAELQSSSSARNAENTIFQQMAAQGQSIFAASGDSGAYDDGKSLSVDDPASQPYVTGVGGTHLVTSGAGGAWSSETTWNGGSISSGGGGGGVSAVWAQPSYQSGLATTANKASSSTRNVPDVSLDADPQTGYAIFSGGKWVIYGGTSCAAPLWSAFTALVNQQRVANGSGTLGFANPALYNLGKTKGATDFHDIADGSTNLYYPAVAGYDCATGWGTINGASLLADLAGGSAPAPTAPATPTGLTASAGSSSVALSWNGVTGATSYKVYRGTASGAESVLASGITSAGYTDSAVTAGTTYFYKVSAVNSAGESGLSAEVSAQPQAVATGQLLGNPGFENGSSAPAPWTVSSGVIDNSTSAPAHSGSWKAWLDGYGRTHTDTVQQTVTIPSGISSATLSFWLRIDTKESGTRVYDKLTVQVKNASGAVLQTLATYSNVNKTNGAYVQRTFDLTKFSGQTVTLYLVGTEDNSQATSFILDDFALTTK